MNNEEKYKLALFAVVRNSSVLPKGIELGKSEEEINAMTIATMESIQRMCDFDRLKELYEMGEKYGKINN